MTDMSKYIKKSDIRCPICQTLLDVSIMSDKVFGCPKCRDMGNIELWQELDRWKQSAEDHQNWLRLAENRLDRTSKKLDIVMDGLKRIEKLTEPSYKNRNLEALALAVNTFSSEIIEQINQRNNNE